MSKICPKCKKNLNFDSYNFDKNGKINSVCKSCKNENYKKWYQKNTQKVKVRKEKYHKRTKEYRRWYHIEKRYGITKDEYMFLYDKQNGKCFICGCEKSGHKNTDELIIDHCHKTNKVRGLLCNRCNTVLGNINEDITIANNIIKYLKQMCHI